MHEPDHPFHTPRQHSAAWWDRAEKCADLVADHATTLTARPSLADIGCGDQKLAIPLRHRAPKFTYRGLDVHPRSPDVVRFDPTREALPQPVDVVACLGAIEYLDSVDEFFERVAARCRYFAVSHVPSDMKNYSKAKLDRRGWRYHAPSSQVEASLEAAGFTILATTITANKKTKIWMCENTDPPRIPGGLSRLRVPRGRLRRSGG